MLINHVFELAVCGQLQLEFADLASLVQTDQLQVGDLSREASRDLFRLEDQGLDHCAQFRAFKSIQVVLDALQLS